MESEQKKLTRISNKEVLQGVETRQVGNNNEIRAKFDALPSPEVSSDNVRAIYEASPEMADGRSLTSRVREWIRSKNIFGKYINDDTGWDVEFNKVSAENVAMHHAGPQKAAIMEIVPDLIEAGIYLETVSGKAPGQKTHVFAGKATIDGEDYAISFAVRESAEGMRYYDHSLTKIKALDQLDQAPKAATEEPHRNIPPTEDASAHMESSTSLTSKPSLNNILKKHLAVNKKNEPTSETPVNRVRNKDSNITDKTCGGHYEDCFTTART